MTDPDDITRLWQQQPVTSLEVDVTELKRMADRFASKVRARNLSEWIAAAFVVLMFMGLAIFGSSYPPLTRVGAVMMALGAALVAYRLHRDGRLRHIPDPTADTERFLSAYRANLEAQAALLESVPRWYLAPLVPGLVTFYVGFVVREPATWWAPLILLAISLLVFAAIGWMNRVGARKLRAQAAKLGA